MNIIFCLYTGIIKITEIEIKKNLDFFIVEFFWKKKKNYSWKNNTKKETVIIFVQWFMNNHQIFENITKTKKINAKYKYV